MLRYPLEKLESICHRIAGLTAEWRDSHSAALDSRIPREERTKLMNKSDNDFMNKASNEVFPEVHRVLEEIDVLLSSEDKALSEWTSDIRRIENFLDIYC